MEVWKCAEHDPLLHGSHGHRAGTGAVIDIPLDKAEGLFSDQRCIFSGIAVAALVNDWLFIGKVVSSDNDCFSEIQPRMRMLIGIHCAVPEIEAVFVVKITAKWDAEVDSWIFGHFPADIGTPLLDQQLREFLMWVFTIEL